MRFRRQEKQKENFNLLTAQKAQIFRRNYSFLRNMREFILWRSKSCGFCYQLTGWWDETRFAEAGFLSFVGWKKIRCFYLQTKVTDLILMQFNERVNHELQRCTVSVFRKTFWVADSTVIRQCTFGKRLFRHKTLPDSRRGQFARGKVVWSSSFHEQRWRLCGVTRP